MVKSKTKINKQLKRKSNFDLVETILTAKKNSKWLEVASLLSGPRRKFTNFNLDEINEKSKDGETVVIAGKVLSSGNSNKKITVVALNFSERAKEKLLKSKIPFSNITEEIKKNPNAKNIRILK